MRATIIDDNVQCKANNIIELSKYIESYIRECYGKCTVTDERGIELSSCADIRHTGNFTIHTSRGDIQCIIENL